MKKFYIAFMLSISLLSLSVVADELDIIDTQEIGELKLGLTQTKLKNILKCPLKLGEDAMWEADGLYHQDWEYLECGVMLDMTSSQKSSIKTIEAITITSPSRLTTPKGIGIGSSKKEVIKAYKKYINPKDSNEDTLVVGHIYGGLVFTLKDNRVTTIFLGALVGC